MIGTEDYCRLENKYGLYPEMVSGVPFWIISRNHVWNNHVIKAANEAGKAHTYKKYGFLRDRLRRWMLLAKPINIFMPRRKELLIINHSRRVLVDGYYECKYTERISDTYDSAVLEGPYINIKHLKPVKTKNLVYMDSMIIKAQYYRDFNRIFNTRRYREVSGHVKNRIKDFVSEVSAMVGKDLDLDVIAAQITDLVFMYIAERRMLKRWLDMIKPKLIVEVCHYDTYSFALNRLAKEYGIKTIEMQHGSLATIPYMYGSKESIPELPDIICTFSEFWNEMTELPGSVRTVATGFPFIEKDLKRYSLKKRDDNKKRNIIFISQGTIGKKLAEMALGLNRIIDHGEFGIIYKLHPGEYADWRERYPDLADSDIMVVDNNRTELYEWFLKCEILVGVYSTAIYEGMSFGLRTYIYPIYVYNSFAALEKKGYVTYIRDEKDLLEHISEGKKNNPGGLEIWTENSVEKIKKVIDGCL